MTLLADEMQGFNNVDGGLVENELKEKLFNLSAPKVLELGTLQWNPGHPTHHGSWLPAGAAFVKSDVAPGQDVDVVADAHDLAPFDDCEFDALIAISVWEHLRKPWLAAAAAHRVLKPGGLIYVATHFTFPIHGYPSDYCRWTADGLLGLFDEPEWKDRKAGHSFPCVIQPPSQVRVWNRAAPAFLNVNIYATKA